MEATRETGVVEHRLHEGLCVVEAALDRDVVDIGREHRGHLAALDIADPPLGVEHEDVDAFTPRHRVDRGRAGIAAGRADDGKVAVGAGQELLEQQAEQLERDILERERGAVEQFEQEMAVVELDERSHRVMAEPAIGARAQFAQLVFAEAARDERGHDADGGFDIGEARHVGDLVGGEARPCDGNVQPAVARQASEGDFTEIEFGRGAARALVAHGGRGSDGCGVGQESLALRV